MTQLFSKWARREIKKSFIEVTRHINITQNSGVFYSWRLMYRRQTFDKYIVADDFNEKLEKERKLDQTNQLQIRTYD